MWEKLTFSHGVHPPEHKDQTSGIPIRRMPFPEEIVLPLRQHAGKPARLLVKVGDRVERGDKIAEADGFVSVPIHSSAAGDRGGNRVVAPSRREHGRGGTDQGREVLASDPPAPDDPSVGGVGPEAGGCCGSDGRGRGPRGSRLPDPCEAPSSQGRPDRGPHRQWGRVRTLPHHGPPDHGGVPEPGHVRGSDHDEGAGCGAGRHRCREEQTRRHRDSLESRPR